jgi:hypothetical protein
VTHTPLANPASRRSAQRASCVLLAVLLGFFASAGFVATAPPAQAASCSGPLGVGDIRVVLVVDAVDIGGGSSAMCLVVPAGTTGSQLLARRGAELGTGSPRYGSSGLLCAIDRRPATGCGDRNSGGYGYWAYFYEADGNWFYGNGNPFTKRLADGAIEGWRFVAGGCGCGDDPQPRIAPSRSLFPALAPIAPQVPAPASPPVIDSAPAVTSPGSPGDGSPPVTPGSESAAIDAGTVDHARSSVEASAGPVDVDGVALASSSTDRSTTGRWIAVVVVALLVAAFAGGAWRQTRRSP